MRSTLSVISALLASDLAAADEPADVPREPEQRPIVLGGWTLELQPYAFVPAKTTGSVALRNMEVPIDISLANVMSALQFFSLVRVEAWNHRFGLIVDNTYARLETRRDLDLDLDLRTRRRMWAGKVLVGFRPIVTGSLELEVDAGMRLSWFSGRVLGFRFGVGPIY